MDGDLFAPAPVSSLDELREEARHCTRCPLHQTRTQVVFDGGNPDAKIFIIGEAPGYDEDKSGKVFVGKSGQLLDKIFAACNFTREKHLYISNILKCRPPGNRTPASEEMAACLPYLEQQINLVDPAIIITLGATALKALLGENMRITRERGSWKLYHSRLLMPTYHPSALLRNPNLKIDALEDFKKVILKYRELVEPGHYCKYI